MHEATRRTARCNGDRQRPQRKIGRESIAHRPTDDATRKQIDEHCKIEPAFASPYVRDVADPFLIRRTRVEVTCKHVRRERQRVVGLRRNAKPSTAFSAQIPLSHESNDAFATHALAGVAQLIVHTRTAVDTIALRVNRDDLRTERLVARRMLRSWPAHMRVIARSRDVQRLAQQPNRVLRLLRGDELEVVHGFSLGEEGCCFLRSRAPSSGCDSLCVAARARLPARVPQYFCPTLRASSRRGAPTR